jgi:conjugal transfer pilus assembly protein TraV
MSAAPHSALAVALLLRRCFAGCTSMSGLSGSSSYACKAPEGVTCDSVSGTYANAVHNNLPSQRSRTLRRRARVVARRSLHPAARPRRVAQRNARRIASVSPRRLRSSARILRLWFKPWEDADRDLCTTRATSMCRSTAASG